MGDSKCWHYDRSNQWNCWNAVVCKNQGGDESARKITTKNFTLQVFLEFWKEENSGNGGLGALVAEKWTYKLISVQFNNHFINYDSLEHPSICHFQNILLYYEIMTNLYLKIMKTMNFLHQNFDCDQIMTCFI